MNLANINRSRHSQENVDAKNFLSDLKNKQNNDKNELGEFRADMIQKKNFDNSTMKQLNDEYRRLQSAWQAEMKDLQAKQAFKHKKEEAELSRYLQAPKLVREKTESNNMEQKLRDKHAKENNDMKSLFNEKKLFFNNKRRELDNLEFQNRERHRREMTIQYNTF